MISLRTLGMCLALAGWADAHGAITFPRSRNAADGALEPWRSWSWKPGETEPKGEPKVGSFSESGKNTQASCSIPSKNGIKGSTNASNGQACFWFSNGCTIGCDSCDGSTNHPGHGNQKFLYKGMNSSTLAAKNISVEAWGLTKGDLTLDPKSFSGKTPLNTSQGLCPNSAKTKATICDKRLRTLNVDAECGSPEDFYYFSPWVSHPLL